MKSLKREKVLKICGPLKYNAKAGRRMNRIYILPALVLCHRLTLLFSPSFSHASQHSCWFRGHIHIFQSDPDLPGYSGKRVLPGKSGFTINRGPTVCKTIQYLTQQWYPSTVRQGHLKTVKNQNFFLQDCYKKVRYNNRSAAGWGESYWWGSRDDLRGN